MSFFFGNRYPLSPPNQHTKKYIHKFLKCTGTTLTRMYNTAHNSPLKKREGNWVRVRFCKDFWHRYWGRAIHPLANLFSLFLVNVPKVFAKVNLAQFSRFFSGKCARDLPLKTNSLILLVLIHQLTIVE